MCLYSLVVCLRLFGCVLWYWLVWYTGVLVCLFVCDLRCICVAIFVFWLGVRWLLMLLVAVV